MFLYFRGKCFGWRAERAVRASIYAVILGRKKYVFASNGIQYKTHVVILTRKPVYPPVSSVLAPVVTPFSPLTLVMESPEEGAFEGRRFGRVILFCQQGGLIIICSLGSRCLFLFHKFVGARLLHIRRHPQLLKLQAHRDFQKLASSWTPQYILPS